MKSAPAPAKICATPGLANSMIIGPNTGSPRASFSRTGLLRIVACPSQARLTDWAEPPEGDKRISLGPRHMLALTGRAKSIIGMAHLRPLPGSPLYDRNGGMQAIIDAVAADIAALQEGGVDAIMFGNEGDRPYVLKAA